jgi:phosphoheptose isomerase
MILSIYCAELSIENEPPIHIDMDSFGDKIDDSIYVSGMEAVNSNGDILFSVSGSDEYGATIHNVDSYKVIKNAMTNDSYIIATVGYHDKKIS